MLHSTLTARSFTPSKYKINGDEAHPQMSDLKDARNADLIMLQKSYTISSCFQTSRKLIWEQEEVSAEDSVSRSISRFGDA
jgi:hypothetical protein